MVSTGDFTLTTIVGEEYSIDGGTTWQTTGAYTLLTPGTYTVEARLTADNTCVAIPAASVTINPVPTSGPSLLLTANNACGTNSNGSISFPASTGMVYGYSIGSTFTGTAATPATNGINTINALDANTYTVRLIDALSCITDETITIGSDLIPSDYTVTGSRTVCAGTQVAINVSGSEAGVTYQLWLNGFPTTYTIPGSTEDIDFLVTPIVGANVYRVRAIPNNPSCEIELSGVAIVNVQPRPTVLTPAVDCSPGAGNATVTINATISTGTLQYSVDGGTLFQTSSIFTGMPNGIYKIVVREITTSCIDSLRDTITCNDPPIGVEDFACSKINGTIGLNVIANDYDNESDPINAQVVASGATIRGGSFTLDAAGNLVYTAPALYTGMDTLYYQVCDQPFKCSQGRVLIKVSNDSAYANPDTASVNKNKVLESNYSVLFNDSTSDGDIFTLTPVSNGVTQKGGSYTLNATGRFTYTPPVDFVGTDVFEYIICDRCGRCDTAEVRISVEEIFIPEGFSPNDDGVHDQFVIEGGEGYKIDIKVFNRWGSLVFEQEDYKGPDWWDGSANRGIALGERLPDGTYYYVIDLNDGKKPRVRHITIKR
ncbi:MAG: Ig-like domain-containing protein [Cytophagaceae bacterium]|nr:Ig-like domain-containing protein [Cytophagaceae bacterium]